MKRLQIFVTLLVVLAAGCGQITFMLGKPDGSAQSSPKTDLKGYFLPDPTVGLSELNSYTQFLTVTFTGTRAGGAVSSLDSYYQEVNRTSDTQFTVMDITNADGVQERTVSGNAGEAYYSKLGDGQCKVSWGSRAEGARPFIPALLLPPLLAATESGTEDVNGVQTTRYTFDAASLGYPETVQATGQVWLAVEDGFVVKYQMTIQDASGLFGEGASGVQVFDYELSRINAGLEPEIPEGCLPVLTEFPLMSDAVDIQRYPGIVAYTSPSSLSDIKAFYEQELVSRGWIFINSALLLDGGTKLEYQHAEMGKVAYIMLVESGSVIWVTLQVDLLESAPPGMLP